MLRRTLVLGLISAVAASSPASATPFTFQFTGTVNSATGIWAGQGTTVTGFYVLDDTLTDSDPSADVDIFDSDTNPAATFEISVSLGAVTRSSADNSLASGAPPHHLLLVADLDSAYDEWLLSANRVVSSDDRIFLDALDTDPEPADGIAPGSGNLNSGPLLSPGDLSLFTGLFGGVDAYDGVGSLEGQLQFTLTSVSPIPEPSTALLLGLGLAGIAVRRRAVS